MISGDIMVSITVAEELLHDDGAAEPVSVIESRIWCRACAPHVTFQRSALNLDPRAVSAQGHAKPNNEEEHAPT
jgi:hypothetical protein